MKLVRPLLFFLLPLLMIACGKSKSPAPKPGENADNKWVYSQMKYYYLWSDELPGEFEDTDQEMDTEDYFNSLLYKKNTVYGDRFSTITDLKPTKTGNAFANEVMNPRGFLFKLYYYDSSKGSIVGIVSYVNKGSSAYQNGLRRGFMFNKINGQTITSTTEINSLINTNGQLVLTVCDPYTLAKVEDIPVTINTSVESNPVVLDTVYNIAGNNIGYMVYTNFAMGTANEYNSALRQLFSKYRQQGLDDFILDLRYNGGGYVNTAVLLGSLLVKKEYLNQPFVITQYNTTYGAALEKRDKEYDVDRFYAQNDVGTQNIDLPRLVVITSSTTASASELIIHCLKPYMDIITIGETTVGKNQSAVSITDSEKKWMISPIIGRIHDKNRVSGYETGITPNTLISEGSNNLFYDFGDLDNELLLRAAVIQLLGSSALSAPLKSATGSHIPVLQEIPLYNDQGAIRLHTPVEFN